MNEELEEFLKSIRSNKSKPEAHDSHAHIKNIEERIDSLEKKIQEAITLSLATKEACNALGGLLMTWMDNNKTSICTSSPKKPKRS